MSKELAPIKGRDIKAEADKVYKLGGRWYRVLLVDSTSLSSGNLFVTAVRHGADPRVADLDPANVRIKYVFADDDVKVRYQPAPEWDWVTRELARREAGEPRHTF